jgi:hypothetical protein
MHGLLLINFLLVSCSGTTKISSFPGGAKVYIDDEFKGKTPYSHTDSKPSWGKIKVTF